MKIQIKDIFRSISKFILFWGIVLIVGDMALSQNPDINWVVRLVGFFAVFYFLGIEIYPEIKKQDNHNTGNYLKKIEEIVKAYGKTVETISPEIPTKYPAMVLPQSLLPFPKEEIKEALNFFIEYTNQDEKIKESLKATAYMLTMFVDDKDANDKNNELLNNPAFMKAALRKKTKIIHFEDEEVLGRMYNTKLRSDGFNAKHFLNPPAEPKDLIKLIQEEKPDIIIMDVIMPLMDGFKATQVLKNNPATKNIPIIGLCNLAQQEDFDQAKKIGMDDYIVNFTITPSQVANRIKDFFKNPSSYKPIFGEYKEN